MEPPEMTDIFGNVIPEDDDEPLDDPEPVEETQDTAEDSEEETEDETTEDALTPDGDEPEDVESVRKYWQGAYTKSRQKDREKYGKIEQEHQQYQSLLANFYQDDSYAMQVLRQRFPNLAGQLSDQKGQATSSPTGQTSNLESEMKKELSDIGLGDLGMERMGRLIERYVDSKVAERIGPIEQRSESQTKDQYEKERIRLLSEMDTKYGEDWEEKHRAQMEELDAFLASNDQYHPKFGSKYELYLKMVNPDIARNNAIRAMGDAARRRTGRSRTGGLSVSNLAEKVRDTNISNSEAFMLAAKDAEENER